jgi:hypothetical protein
MVSILKIKIKLCQQWWRTAIIPALWRLRQEDLQLKTRQAYLSRSCLIKENDEGDEFNYDTF